MNILFDIQKYKFFTMVGRRCCLCDAVSGVSFHTFPKNDKMRLLWKQVCNYQSYDNISTLVICSLHFKPSDYMNPNFKRFGGRARLKLNSYPSVHVPNKIQIESSEIINVNEVVETKEIIAPVIEKIIDKKSMMYIVGSLSNEDDSMNIYINNEDQNEPVIVKSPKQKNISEKENSSLVESFSKVESSLNINAKEQEDEIIINSPKRRKLDELPIINDFSSIDLSTPEKAESALSVAMEIISNERSKNHVLRHQIRKLMKKITSLQDIVLKLKRNEAGDI